LTVVPESGTLITVSRFVARRVPPWIMRGSHRVIMADSNRIRIAYVLPYLVAGGAERHVLSLVRGIDRARFSPVVIALAGGGELEADFLGEGIPVHVLCRNRLSPPQGRDRKPIVGALTAFWSLYGILRRDRPRFVHAYLPAANVLGPVAARMAGVPRVIVSKRSGTFYQASFPLLRYLERIGSLLADVVMVNSEAVHREVERTERPREGKFRRIYNGVVPIPTWTPVEIASFRAREGLPPRAPVAVCVSNFFEYKGHEDLVKAAAQVVGELPDLTYVLIGRDAGSLEAVRALAKDLGILQRFRFIGARFDVPDFLRAADLFVHPSHQEGFSNAILEAMAAGLPVVACDVGGNPEAVVDGVTGRLVPSRCPGRLAGAMSELLGDEGKRRAMGEAGRRRAEERFSLGRMVAEVEAMYDSLVPRKGGGA
jgi:glycosyltransferase involved in cell wall biosynthesis